MVYLLIVVAFAFDRLSKWWAVSYLAQHGPISLFDVLIFRATLNRGMVFGLFQGVGSWVGWLSIIIVAGLLLYLTRLPRGATLMRVGLALIIGGALGNLVDRVTAGEVVDFIATSFMPWVFNLADVFVNGGMLLFASGSLLKPPHRPSSLPDNSTSS